MSKVLKMDKGAEQSVIGLLKFLLDSGNVHGVLTLRQINESGSVDYGLVTHSRELDRAVPLMPVMPANAAQILSRLTPSRKPLAVVVKPCELRGFVERIKREQGSLENLLVISQTCGGVIPLKVSIESDKKKLTADYYQVISKGEIPDNIRPSCKACEYFVPMTADITVSMIGESVSSCRIYLNSDKAISMTQGFDVTAEDGEPDASMTEAYLTKRQDERSRLFKEIQSGQKGLDDLLQVFSKCIGCHACSRVCPICYCVLCDFESRHFDQNATLFEKELKQKGGLRLPPDTLFFHLGRMSHMSFSCVGCGQCTDVCPAGIDVSVQFMKTGEAAAALFNYVPGKDMDEEIPVMVFKEEEFKELGE